MSARILVVDDLAANVKLLEARLSAEYFDVRTAMSGAECLSICAEGNCDIVLLDVMMPGMDGFEVCRRLKADVNTAHVPVVMVTALDQASDRVRGLQAGADDFLTKPVDELALIARVRSLTRLKLVVDELRARVAGAATIDIREPLSDALIYNGNRGRLLLVDDRAGSAERIVAALRDDQVVDVEANAQEALFRGAEGGYDLMVVSLGLKDVDPLRLCSQIRSFERTRQMPILMVAEPEDRARVMRGLDLGVNDYLSRPIDRNELLARVRTQVRRKRYVDNLRKSLQSSIEMAVLDALTGLHNRRYLESSLPGLMERSVCHAKPLAMMILDIDHFKKINDTWGHDAGDAILKQFAERIRATVRVRDVVCRLGGEEFVIVMPEAGVEMARRIGERVRAAVEASTFPVSNDVAIPVTVSVGIAERGQDSSADGMFKRADRALYRSKHEGRNRVSAEAA